tara:strand:- start:398 stop:985 length:588 start_codon:yes stop_codon:yes gene_type:complete
MKKVAIYCRVSTEDQSIEHQKQTLLEYAEARNFEVIADYADIGVSGAKETRPDLDRLMEDARKRKFEMVLVWKFDRFARSSKLLALALDEFRSLGIEFVSFTENIDTSSPLGQAMFSIISAMAQLERDLTAERIKSGMDHAKRRGKKLGRPSTEISFSEVAQMKDDRKSGLSIRQIAGKYDRNRSTVHRLLRQAQ